jgi:hypothetical protein
MTNSEKDPKCSRCFKPVVVGSANVRDITPAVDVTTFGPSSQREYLQGIPEYVHVVCREDDW